MRKNATYNKQRICFNCIREFHSYTITSSYPWIDHILALPWKQPAQQCAQNCLFSFLSVLQPLFQTREIQLFKKKKNLIAVNYNLFQLKFKSNRLSKKKSHTKPEEIRTIFCFYCLLWKILKPNFNPCRYNCSKNKLMGRDTRWIIIDKNDTVSSVCAFAVWSWLQDAHQDHYGQVSSWN